VRCWMDVQEIHGSNIEKYSTLLHSTVQYYVVQYSTV